MGIHTLFFLLSSTQVMSKTTRKKSGFIADIAPEDRIFSSSETISEDAVAHVQKGKGPQKKGLKVCPGMSAPYGYGVDQNLCSTPIQEGYAQEIICAQLLDDYGMPLKWGTSGNFWDWKLHRFQAEREQEIRLGQIPKQTEAEMRGEDTSAVHMAQMMINTMRMNKGDSWCISLVDYGEIVIAAGCENARVTCDATAVRNVLQIDHGQFEILKGAQACIKKRCITDVNLANQPFEEHACHIITASAIGLAVGAAVAAVALQRRTSRVSSGVILG